MNRGAYDEPTIALIKRQIEAQLADYEREVAEYAAFMERYRTKQEKNVSRELVTK